MSRRKGGNGPAKGGSLTRPVDNATKAKHLLSPSLNAAALTQTFAPYPAEDLNLEALRDELAEQCQKVMRGDMGRAEAMLIAQAHTLDAMFTGLARRSHANMGEYTDAAEKYMRLALRAQSQCRATLETLATIKNPPVVIARQANIAHGPQQVNNGSVTSTHARTREIQSEPSELLEHTHGERLDPGATGQAIGSDPAMATVGAFDRPAHGGR